MPKRLACACRALGQVHRLRIPDAEPGLHAARGLAPGTHRLDHGGGAGHDVAAGEDTGHRGREVLVRLDVAAAVQLQLRSLADDRVRVGADGDHHRLGLEFELAAGDRHRAAAARFVRLAEFHANAPHPAHVALAVVQDLDRVGEPVEFDAFLLRVVHFFDAARALGLGAPVDAVDLFGAEPLADAGGVHRGIAGADHSDAPPERQGRVMAGIARAHHVAAGEQLVRRQHVVERIAGDAHELGIARAGADEDGVKPHLADHLLDREQPPDERVALELHPELAQVVDFSVDHLVGQPEVGNAVAQHAAGHVEGLVYRDFAPGLGHVGRARHPGRARADDADPEAARLDVGDVGPALLDRHVADEALEAADGDRLQALADGAGAFALRFLRADAAADGGEQVGVGDDIVGAPEILLPDLPDEAGNVDADRAAFDARRVRAEQAALGFPQRVLDA